MRLAELRVVPELDNFLFMNFQELAACHFERKLFSIKLEIHNPTTSELTFFKCQKKFYNKDPFVNHVSLRDRARAADPAFFFLIDLVGFWAGCRARGLLFGLKR